jgi:hypothetical protein
MSLTPLKINSLGDLLQNSGFNINSDAVTYMGSSTSLSNYTQGTTVSSTVLAKLSTVINLAYQKIGSGISSTVYQNLISIGSTTIPALGNSKPSTYTNTYTGQITRFGWLRLIPYQAYNEFYLNNGSYSDFTNTLSTCFSKKNQLNDVIKSANNSITFLDGIYSNMNDLITSDITGVSLSTFYWGQDLITLGKAIDLTSINTFGEPVNLLRTLYKNQALTKSINLALLSAGMSTSMLTRLIEGETPTLEQQRLMYSAFCVIVGNDLAEAMIPLNCQTIGLETLADLLDVKKLFPNSYKTLTFPVFNGTVQPTNSKTYYLIYSGNSPNLNSGVSLGTRLRNMVPAELAATCDAFSLAMLQIKNIQSMNIEKFSQVVFNLENTEGLVNISGTTTPTNPQMANSVLNSLAKGSNSDGSYNMCDFFGSMTNLHYRWEDLQTQIKNVQSLQLDAIYNEMLTVMNSTDYSTMQILINRANQEITNIKNTKATLANQLNATYSQFGSFLQIEQTARSIAIPNVSDLETTSMDIIAFEESLDSYAQNTEVKGMALVIENICNRATIGGNSTIGAMREARNAIRLGLTGTEQDNDVNSSSELVLPRPTGKTLNELPINGFTSCSQISNVPIVTGAATIPGSLAGSSETTLIPTNLSILIQPVCDSVVTPDEAVNQVVLCNCDCWDNL